MPFFEFQHTWTNIIRNTLSEPGVVTLACNPVYSEGGAWEDHSSKLVWAKNFMWIHLNQWLGGRVQWCTPVIPTGQGSIMTSSCIKQSNISKIINTKRTDGLAQVVECLPIKHEAWSLKALMCFQKKVKKKKKCIFFQFSVLFHSTNICWAVPTMCQVLC
jgi:hypothetical protein